MQSGHIRAGLVCAFALVLAANVAAAFEGPFAGALACLLIPATWLVYDIFQMNNHGPLPFASMEAINILVYWIAFALLIMFGARLRQRTGHPDEHQDP